MENMEQTCLVLLCSKATLPGALAEFELNQIFTEPKAKAVSSMTLKNICEVYVEYTSEKSLWLYGHNSWLGIAGSWV